MLQLSGLLSNPVICVPAGPVAGWYVCIHVSPGGCDHVGHGQQKVRCKCEVDGHVTSAGREEESANW